MKYLFSLLFIFTFSFSQEMITPIPLKIDIDIDKALLGKKLFNDKRLSKNNTISCASCHFINEGGDNNLTFAIGVNGQSTTRNTPTVLNSTFNSTQFWDARAKNLEEQVKSSIVNPIEMGSTFEEITSKLNNDKNYLMEFQTIYKNGITKETIANAIAEYQNTLITPNSKFDKYLRGNINILSQKEIEGFILFKKYGCISCHNGVNVGGNLIQKIGINEVFETNDLGRYAITNNLNDKFYFKVPTLRNIELTAPYFHDGSIPTLKKAIEKMAYHQIGYKLDDEKINKIELFLKTLSAKVMKIDKNDE